MNEDFKVDRTMFRSKGSNARKTRALFHDVLKELFNKDYDVSECMYSLRDDKEVEGLPSLHRLYLEMEDITEYDFANKYFENYEHWMMVVESPHVGNIIHDWRRELDLKLRAKALNNIKEIASNEMDKNYWLANKLLVSQSWIPRDSQKELVKNGRGRPSKEEISRTARQMAQDEMDIAEDLKRVQEAQTIN